MKVNNHYVPKTYLKQWANKTKIFEYSLLVSHQEIPKWKESSISHTANINSLYIYYDGEDMSDEMEDFFSEEFEMKYNSFLENLNPEKKFSEVERDYISKLIASQHLRTLKGFNRVQKFVVDTFPETIKEVCEELNQRWEITKSIPKTEEHEQGKFMPVKTTIITDDCNDTMLKIETYAGKSYWLVAMKHLLQSTYKVLNNVSWCVYDAPKNYNWVTSDDPVIFLNYYGKNSYDFEGGWGNENTNIIFPLTPKKILFGQIGMELKNHDIATYEFADEIQKYIVENAYGKVYSIEKNVQIPKIRKRIVDQELFYKFQQSLKNFHSEYLDNELPYLKNSENEYGD